MNLHEYQGKEILNSFGVRIQRGIVASTPIEAVAAAKKLTEDTGGHSASIMTKNDDNANNFMQQVDCAAVYKNSSTRFTDGGQLGVGAELAISTDKLHHRGPLGLKELVTNKYYIFGDGHVRN